MTNTTELSIAKVDPHTPDGLRAVATFLDIHDKPVLASELRVLAAEMETKQANAARALLVEVYGLIGDRAEHYNAAGQSRIGRDFAHIRRIIREGRIDAGLDL